MRSCMICNVVIAPGSRWCDICRAHAFEPKIGRLASPGKRLGAHLLDFSVWFTAMYSSAIFGILGFPVFICYMVFSIAFFLKGTSIGKKVFGMRVVKSDGTDAGFLTMVLREWIGKTVSALFLCMGFLSVSLDRNWQGWHDKIANTYVVEKRLDGKEKAEAVPAAIGTGSS